MRTIADVKYKNRQLSTVEITYNAVSFIAAIITIVVFTVYAKRKLNDLKKAEAKAKGPLTE